MRFNIYIQNSSKSKNFAEMFEVHFKKDFDALHYALDLFDFKKHKEITVFKNGKLLMKFGREQ